MPRRFPAASVRSPDLSQRPKQWRSLNVSSNLGDLYNLQFTPKTLPEAVRQIFALNGYDVTGPEQHFGAEVDLIARNKHDIFHEPIYIEVTVAYVDNDKYGKDSSKFIGLKEQNQHARCLIVSSKGFSVPVKERAKASRVELMTYDDLLRRFEQFDPYLRSIFIDGPQQQELALLRESYEDPTLEDSHGSDDALAFLEAWRDKDDIGARWLIIVGEYGTGKTALTKVLQYDWNRDYAANPSSPIAFRMELRDFTRQFDADGLIHHFLDRNRLSHITVEYVHQLIRSGRLVLILDGYDEMAQYMTTRERRACLEALATLSHDGARGILTSRPNYFSEAEELTVLEALYKELSAASVLASSGITAVAEQEHRVDMLLDSQFINRFERTLRDLTPDQTVAFVKRKLAHNAAGQTVVLDILGRIFRDEGTSTIALSGKPVIITYLLEVVDALLSQTETPATDLTEWGVYKLILDNLMIRDFQRTPELVPSERREFLRRLAIFLTRRDNPTISEAEFRDLAARDYKLRPGLSDEERRRALDARFEDLRASTTLTRSNQGNAMGWRFSHNSLREFLLTEYCLIALMKTDVPLEKGLPISEPMREFAASQPAAEIKDQFSELARRWNDAPIARGMWLTLLWAHVERAMPSSGDSHVADMLSALSGGRRLGAGTSLSRIALSCNEEPQTLSSFEFSDTELLNVRFTSADLKNAKFVNAWLDGCDFQDCDLSGCNFSQAVLHDVHLTGAKLDATVFVGIDEDSSVLVAFDGQQLERLTGPAMTGYLKHMGGHTGTVPDYWFYIYSPRFSIIDKICRKLTEQATRQVRGLAQRGVAASDTAFATGFVDRLIAESYVEYSRGRASLISITPKGREELGKFINGVGYLPPVVAAYLKESAGV